MRKGKTFLSLLLILFMATNILSACGSADVQNVIDNNISKLTPTKLDTPSGIELGEDNVLRWSAVNNASSYVITIDGVDYSSSVPSLNLTKILNKNGNYEAYVKALSDRTSYENSDISAPYKFNFDGVKLIEDGNKTTGVFGLFDDIYTKEAYIGYGYDVIGSSYVNANEVKMNYRIFDEDKLKSKNLVMIKDHDSEDYYIYGDSISEYQASVELKMGSKVNISKMFALSVNGKFARTMETTESVLFYEYSHTTKAYQLILQCDFDDYKEMLTSSFKSALMTSDIGTLFKRYGTHVITSVVMGGRFDLDYTVMSNKAVDVASMAIDFDATLKSWGANTNIDISANLEAKAKENNSSISSQSHCYGGDYVQMNTEKAIMANYQDWLSTVENKPALVGIRDINSLVPIWELLGDSEDELARKAELEKAFEKYGSNSYNSLLENYSIKQSAIIEENSYEWIDDNYILFGSYPQANVTNAMGSTLSGHVTNKPTNGNDNGWTSYGYYISGLNSTDYMWYKDVVYNGEKYRAVYFSSYRPKYTSYSSSANNTAQDENGYFTNTVYWFKWQPIKWRILYNKGDYALIMSDLIIDSQEYYNDTSNRTINGNTVYANNYEYSNIRAWLNNDFYNTAFSNIQKNIIQITDVDNSVNSTYPNGTSGPNAYAGNNTRDKVFLLSENQISNTAYGFSKYKTSYYTDPKKQLKATAYAKIQGCLTLFNLNQYNGNGQILLRSPSGVYYKKTDRNVGLNAASRYVDGDGYDIYCAAVDRTDGGIVPAMEIKL